ncbi:MAG: 16S rRNA (guanine(966)-N(2))-methyltransferase RsmD, partial [Prevotella sp.]
LVFEHGANNDFSSDPHFVEHRSYGSVNFSIFRK